MEDVLDWEALRRSLGDDAAHDQQQLEPDGASQEVVHHEAHQGGVLTDALQVHLLRQILEDEESLCTLSNSVLSLVAKLLISRFQRGVAAPNDPLAFELWTCCLDSIVSKIHSIQDNLLPTPSTSLPSEFQVEVLFMAYHSLDNAGRSTVMRSVISASSSCKLLTTPKDAGSLVPSALLVSRLLLITKYLLGHFDNFPNWLLNVLSRKLQPEKQSTSTSRDEVPFLSPAGVFARHVVGLPLPGAHQTIDEQIIQDMLDVDFPSTSTAAPTNADISLLQLVVCGYLDAWTGKVIDSLDELILERYLFLLALDILRYCASSSKPSFPWEIRASTTMQFVSGLFQCTLSVLEQKVAAGSVQQWSHFLLDALSNLEVTLRCCPLDLASWDLPRQGATLALLLVPLEAGLEGGSEFFEQVAGSLVSSPQLLQVLTSILRWYMDAAKRCLCSILEQRQTSEEVQLTSLVLRSCLPADKRRAVLEQTGASVNFLKALMRWDASATWRSELTKILQSGTGGWDCRPEIVPVLLHGFPLHPVRGDAALVSCMLSLEALLEAVAKSAANSALGFDSQDLLTGVMMMKTDSLYDSLRTQCDAVLDAAFEEQVLYKDLYLLKHMEELLRSLREEDGKAVREGVVLAAVTLIAAMKADPSRSSALSLRFCQENHQPTKPDVCSSFIGGGSFLPFIQALDDCSSEAVNVKALQLFVDMLESPSNYQASFRQQMQEKILDMETTVLSTWFEHRFLGCLSDDRDVKQLSSSPAAREVAIRFIQAVCPAGDEAQKKQLTSHILDALLLKLERTFTSYDASSAKSFFTCAVQLASEYVFLRKVATAVIEVLPKVPTDSTHLEGLKCLLSFLSSVLIACGAQKAFSHARFGKSRSLTQSQGLSGVKPRVVRRGSDQTLSEAGNTECDATSVDEDEDDVTSDGEMASLDRDEEDESVSERSLASKVCTFTSSGSNFMEQHWYFCYTCDLTVSKGCCSVCAKVCHRGHKVVYSRLSRFFCDCGAGGVRGTSCFCLKPRKYSPTSTSAATKPAVQSAEPVIPSSIERFQPSDSESETDSDEKDLEVFELRISEQEQRRLLPLLSDLNLESQLLSLSQKLLASSCPDAAGEDGEIRLGEDKLVSYRTDMFQLKRAYKSGCLDMKIKADYSNSRELRSHLQSGALVKSLLSVNCKGKLAAGEGDKVTIFDVGSLIGQPTAMPVTVDKTAVKSLSKNSVRFETVHIVFNPTNENYLAVAGYEDCLVFTVNPRGEVIDRLAIELPLQGAYIRGIAWVPGSQVELMVVTNKFVNIFDLSVDKISPVHHLTVLEDQIVDATLLVAGQGQLLALVLSQQGIIYTERINKDSSGARILTDFLLLPERFQRTKGVSLRYFPSVKVLFASFSGDGLCLACRLDSDAKNVSEVSAFVEAEGEQVKYPGFHHWKEILEGNELFVCLSGQKSNSATAVQLGKADIQAQHLRLATNSSTLRVDGIASYKSVTKDRSHVLVLYDDGSLHVFTYTPSEGATAAETQKQSTPAETEHMKKLGALLSSRSVSPPVFPLDFFEKTTCITPELRFGGDILRNTDSEGVKHSLASDDGFVESPSASGFKILVLNSNPDMVMVGCRIHVGNTSASHIPLEVRVFQRSVKLEEGVRSWYDIPFTNSEALLADEEFALTIGPTFNGTSLPRIDNLEIYGRTKEDFGWKEKLDAVLDVENQHSSSGGLQVKGKKLQTASTLEQVFHEAFRVLCAYYSLSDANLERCTAKCAPVLETIFGSGRHTLQSSGKRLLRALSTNKDSYYQAKDAMALSGVARSCPYLASKLSFGGTCMPWVVREFSSQVRTICKISLHRPTNLASYLEHNGPAIVDSLVSVLWEILLLDCHDPQTINDLVVLTVDLLYGYTECLTAHLSSPVTPSVTLLERLLFAPYDAVRSSCSLALSSRLLQVPLPKQTILSMDECGENSRTASLHSESGASTAPSGQAMLEEDTGTASVQYCCDGCSTVPIQRRRWHCNVCPDFDLCESCFEVMDADQLPPPHTRDHSMSVITIEADGGGDNQDLQFPSIDDMSEESLLQMATELSLQSTPASLASVLEAHDNCELTEIVSTKSGSISASKSAVNSLLLNGLLDNTRGWTKRTTGTVAIPLMQLFYRLATAPSSPVFESGGNDNLQKLMKSLLDELEMENPLSLKSRSSFGEVMVLIFMFFTLLVRYWHQPGFTHGQPRSEGSETNDFGKACTFLRQQALVNFLFNLIQQLVQVFKSSSSSQDSHAAAAIPPCGALLAVKREFASGSFTPFFSDSYAKAHKCDLFAEFHKLLLESSFRLTYSLVRPGKSEKSCDKEQPRCPGPELKLEGWQEVLCSYINNPRTAFVRKYARRLLLHLCGSKNHYYTIRDSWQLNKEVKKLNKLVHKSGGFQSVFPYERSVKILKCLTSISDVASARPRNWQRYCSRHSEVIPFLLSGSFFFAEELVVQTLKLLALVFFYGKDSIPCSRKDSSGEVPSDVKKEKKSANEDASGVDKGYLDMEQAVEQLVGGDEKNLKCFMNAFLLEWNATSVRSEAKGVLAGAWHHGGHAFKVLLLTLLMEKIPLLPSYGQNVQEFNELLLWLLKKGTQEDVTDNQEIVLIQGCLTGNIIKKIFETLRQQNELLANHPNSRIYSTLGSLVEFDGYYLESEPCLACNSPEVPYTRMKLENIKAETKFTDNRILVKCVGSHTIQSVTMNVHDPRRSKSIRVLNLYYNNRVVSDLTELKNNLSAWKRAKSCQLSFGQTELKVEFPIPITACNFMIELDSFYENLQAASLETLQCPRCSRLVTDKHGICANCHENAYQCRQCRNINYENLDSFLCNECGYSKYGRFEFNFMAKPSYSYDRMENDEDMKKGLAAIEAESENAHKKYQQLLGYKKPLLKLVSSIGESEIDSQQKDSVQQMIVPVTGTSSIKINRKIAILGVLYGEKCKMAFDSVSKSVQTLQGLRRVLMLYLERKKSSGASPNLLLYQRHRNHCFGCANTFVGHCLEWLQVLAKIQYCRQQLVGAGMLPELFENNIHQGPKLARVQARAVLAAYTEGDAAAVSELNSLVKQKVMYCLDHHRSMDIAACVRDEMLLLAETCSLGDEFWEARLRVVFQILFKSIQVGARHPVIAEHIILPSLRIVSQACTPPKADNGNAVLKHEAKEEDVPKPQTSLDTPQTPVAVKSEAEKQDAVTGLKGQDLLLVNYLEWSNGATYLDFVRRQYKVAAAKPTQKVRKDVRKADSVALKYLLRWKRRACKHSLTDELKSFEDSSWVRELVLSACSQPIRQEICALIEVLCSQSIVRRSKFLDLLMNLLSASRGAGECAADYFELLFKMIEPEDARLYLTVRGFLRTACSLITEEVNRVEAQERSFHTDISQGYILNKLIELLSKFLQVPNIQARFMKEGLLSQVLEALLVIRGLVVQKTKLISDCARLLRELLDDLLQESYENKRHFIRACVTGLQSSPQNKNRRSLFVLEQLCDIICPTKPEPAYMLILNKAHTQEEFIRGSMTKNPYSSLEIGPLMRDVKNKICQQLELLGLVEDDYGMELLVAGNIISLDLSVSLVYEQVWKKAHGSNLLSTSGLGFGRECPPMTVTYRLQGLDGEATEPMIKELDDDREESQDPEVEFAITGVMNECGGLTVLLKLVQQFTDEELKSSQEHVAFVLKLLMCCCKIRVNRQALLQLGALDIILETARRAFGSEPVEALLLIVEQLVSEANESDMEEAEGELSSSSSSTRSEQAAKGILMFLERLSNSVSSKQSKHRNSDAVARILPYLTFGEEAAMKLLVEHFLPYLDWDAFDTLQKRHSENSQEAAVDASTGQNAVQHQLALDNFIKMTESIKLNVFGERLKDLILSNGIVAGAAKYLKSAFPLTEVKDYKSSSEWNHSLELPSVPLVLSMLRGLSKGHLPTQECLDNEGILELLHALEGVTGDNNVGAKAENLLDTLSDKEGRGEGFLSDKIMSLRDNTRDEMKRRALQRREELLQGLGMRREIGTDGGERIVISQPSIEGLEELEEEETGLACMVCREGYKLRPTDMLGTYSYSKRVNVGSGHGRAEWVYSTVSHFNVIHFQCHLEAKRADASLKNPKKEWEGAALRNNETLCNNLFPLRGPAVPLAQYSRCVDTFWDNLNSLGRADGSRLRLLTYDIVQMLGRFATGASFSADCKGGGKESNSRLLPFMFQMGRHLLDQQGPNQRRVLSKALQAYIAPEAADSQAAAAATKVPSSPGTPQQQQHKAGTEDNVQFMMLQSILLHSYDEWLQHRKSFLQRGAVHAYNLHKQGRAMLPSPLSSGSSTPTRGSLDVTLSFAQAVADVKKTAEKSSNTSMTGEELFGLLKPMLVFIGIVEQLQRHFKRSSSSSSRRTISSSSSRATVSAAGSSSAEVEGGEPWEVSMKERLRDVSSMLAFSKELLEWLDEMQSSQDLQEALDVMGALGDVLSSPGCASCDDFFRDSIGIPRFSS